MAARRAVNNKTMNASKTERYRRGAKTVTFRTQNAIANAATPKKRNLRIDVDGARAEKEGQAVKGTGRRPKAFFSILESTDDDQEDKDDEARLPETDLTATAFCQLVQEQVGDVHEFMKLKGVNLNDHNQYNTLINNGIAIREHFR